MKKKEKEEKQIRILLVYPRSKVTNYSDIGREVVFLTKKPGGLLNASLATLAALTPGRFDLRIVNENLEPVPFDEKWDIVGITGYISHFYRARKIAMEFLRRGVAVVCGGPSVSLSPERWRPFATTLIIGEAERTWPQFLKDFCENNIKKEYRETERFDLSISPVPDFSAFPKSLRKKYLGGIVQTSRGCPFNCEFCDVVHFMGRKKRYKPIDTILKELDGMAKMGQTRSILLADDNFSADADKAKEILRALRDWNRARSRKVPFITMVSIDIAQDDEFLRLAAEAGLTRIFVGIETPNTESLQESRKFHNIGRNIMEDIRNFYRHGILLLGGCMVGFDHDDISIFKRQFDFFMESGIPGVHALPVQAADGTQLKERMIREGRYIDWEKKGNPGEHEINELNTLTFVPKQMTLDQLREGSYWLLWELYKPGNFVKRFEIFFECFEKSDKKAGLAIPKTYIDLEGIGIVVRILKYLLFRATKEERWAFKKMYEIARRSSHPQRYGIFIENFLTLKNTTCILMKECPQRSRDY